MASTVTIQTTFGIGNRWVTIGTAQLGTYTTNGIDITPGQVKLSSVDAFVAGPASGIVFERLSTNKVVARWNGDATPAALPEVTNSTDLSLMVFPFIAVGKP